jgi:hypothetical protein
MTKFRAINLFSLLILFVSFALTIYGIFHSFDWTDEAWSYSLIANARISPGEPWAYQYLLHPIFLLLGESIISFRFLRLILFVMLALFGSYVATRILKVHNFKLSFDSKFIIYLSAQIGTILLWAWPPRGFAYNELASLIFQLVVFLFAMNYVISRELSEHSNRNKLVLFYSIWFVCGLMVGLLFYAKFVTSFIAMLILCAAPYLLLISQKLISFLLSVLGLTAGLFLPLLMGAPFVLYAQSVFLNVFDEQIRAANGHSESLIEMYLSNFQEVLFQYLPLTLVVFLALYWFKSAGRNRKSIMWKARFVPYLMLLGILIYIANFILLLGFGPSGTGALALTLMFGSLGILLSLAIQPNSAPIKSGGVPGRKSLVFLLVLAILSPFLVALGTNNPLMDHLAFESTIWCILFGLALSIYLDRLVLLKSKVFLFPALVMFTVICMTCYLSVMHARNPYRAASFKVTNSTIENVHFFEGLHVTAEEARWVDWLAQSSQELNAQDVPTLSLNSPAALLAFNNNTFASPWLTSLAPASYETMIPSCANVAPQHLFILQPHTEMNQESLKLFKQALKKYCGLDFPQQFDLVRTFDSADTRFGLGIWKLK